MFHGFDFDATMLRIASMNLMLHGVDNPDIHYQDTLSNSFPEKFAKQATGGFDVILANPPFKGSLDEGDVHPTLTQAVKTKKTELLFVALILRMLKKGGRSATIVPDGVLFGSSQGAHRAAQPAGEGEPARGGDLAAERRVQAVRGRVDGDPRVHQGRQDRPRLLLRRRRRRLLARRQARPGQRERPARRARALAEAEREEGHRPDGEALHGAGGGHRGQGLRPLDQSLQGAAQAKHREGGGGDADELRRRRSSRGCARWRRRSRRTWSELEVSPRML
jgi:hypothetical protein